MGIDLVGKFEVGSLDPLCGRGFFYGLFLYFMQDPIFKGIIPI